MSACTRLVALHQVLLEHNGWSDTEGVAYPAADDEAFWPAVLANGIQGAHLAGCLVRGIREAAAGAPLAARNGAK
ncbi:MAG TPA: hypothetical protein VNM48_06785 [Chloroflexota bacterium]|nr:hypothetical protein [Chloroflexota bacterium]